MSEYTTVQEPMLRYSDQIGWMRVSPSASHANAWWRYRTLLF